MSIFSVRNSMSSWSVGRFIHWSVSLGSLHGRTIYRGRSICPMIGVSVLFGYLNSRPTLPALITVLTKPVLFEDCSFDWSVCLSDRSLGPLRLFACGLVDLVGRSALMDCSIRVDGLVNPRWLIGRSPWLFYWSVDLVESIGRSICVLIDYFSLRFFETDGRCICLDIDRSGLIWSVLSDWSALLLLVLCCIW